MKYLWLLVLLCSAQIAAAYQQQSVYDFDIKHWTSADGLSSNSVRAVSQDQQGFIWLATVYGLNRFDGLQFEHFTAEQHRHLASNFVTRLLNDSNGYMWVGTKSGLSGFNPQTLKFDRYPILAEVTSLVQIAPDELWVAAENLFKVGALVCSNMFEDAGLLILDRVVKPGNLVYSFRRTLFKARHSLFKGA